jgi:hypothetical protein
MRTKLVLVAALAATAAAFGPLPTASAICDPEFEERTGYCSQCHLVQAHSQRPEEIICPA